MEKYPDVVVFFFVAHLKIIEVNTITVTEVLNFCNGDWIDGLVRD